MSTAVLRLAGAELFGTPSSSEPLGFPEDQSLAHTPSGGIEGRAVAELEEEYSRARAEGSVDDTPCLPNQLSYLHAKRFLDRLGPGMEPTDAYFNRDGVAVLEWHPTRGRATTIQFLGDGRARYAAERRGGTRTFGTTSLTVSLPAELLIAIRMGGVG